MLDESCSCHAGTKLQWSSAIGLVVFVWLFAAFWAAMPLIGWGEYDYEPLRTCCTLDYSKGDRYKLIECFFQLQRCTFKVKAYEILVHNKT